MSGLLFFGVKIWQNNERQINNEADGSTRTAESIKDELTIQEYLGVPEIKKEKTGYVINIILKGVVMESGKWSNDVFGKIKKMGIGIERYKHLKKSDYEKAYDIIGLMSIYWTQKVKLFLCCTSS